MARRVYNLDEYRKDRRLVEAVEEEGVSFSDFNSDLEAKERILKGYGYRVLYGEGGIAVAVKDCTSAKVTRALLNVYENAGRQIERFESEIRNSLEYRNLAELIRAEQKLEGESLERARERTAIVMADASEATLAVLSRRLGRVRSRELMGDFYRG